MTDLKLDEHYDDIRFLVTLERGTGKVSSVGYYVSDEPVSREDFCAIAAAHQAESAYRIGVVLGNVDNGTGIFGAVTQIADHMDASEETSFANQLIMATVGRD